MYGSAGLKAGSNNHYNFHYDVNRMLPECPIPGVRVLELTKHHDSRGFLCETLRDEWVLEDGNPVHFVQENECFSNRGVLRGLHFQFGEHAQAKLIRCVSGRILDVAVDLRISSATCGKYWSIELTDENPMQLFLPRGLAHGFIVLSENARVLYKMDACYHPPAERGIRWNDPHLSIDWMLPESEMILSENDRNLPAWNDAPKFP